MPVIASLEMIVKELYLLGNSYMFFSALFIFRYTKGKYLLVLKLWCIYTAGLKFLNKTNWLKQNQKIPNFFFFFFLHGILTCLAINLVGYQENFQTLPDVQRRKVKPGKK